MGVTVAEYKRLIKSLLPSGVAWNKAEGSNLDMICEGIAQELVRVDGRSDDLLREADPRQANELLGDWERAYGLPDACAPASGSLETRRQQLFQKIVTGGGQSRAYYTLIAEQFGFNVTIKEFRQFRAGRGRSGDACYSDAWIFYWRMEAADFDITRFRSGQGRSGDRLATWSNDVLECIFARSKPAHTEVLFSYGS